MSRATTAPELAAGPRRLEREALAVRNNDGLHVPRRFQPEPGRRGVLVLQPVGLVPRTEDPPVFPADDPHAPLWREMAGAGIYFEVLTVGAGVVRGSQGAVHTELARRLRALNRDGG